METQRLGILIYDTITTPNKKDVMTVNRFLPTLFTNRPPTRLPIITVIEPPMNAKDMNTLSTRNV